MTNPGKDKQPENLDAPIDEDYKTKDLEMQKEMIETAKREAKYALNDLFKGLSSDLAGQESAAKIVLIEKPLENLKKRWEQARKTAKTKRDLKEARDIIAAEMAEMPQVIKGYSERMAGGTSEDILAKIIKGDARASKMAEMMIDQNKYSDLYSAAKWALGVGEKVKEKDGGERSHVGTKPEAFAIVKKYLKGNSPVRSIAWTVIKFMKNSEQKEFCEEFGKELPLKELVEFLKEANKQGLIGPEDMKKIINESGAPQSEILKVMSIEFTEKKEKQYELLRAAQTKFMMEAKKSFKKNYGSDFGVRNKAAQMITLKNIGLFVAQLSMAATIFGNVVANAGHAWQEGSISEFKPLNEWTAGAMAGLTAIHYAKKDTPLSEILRSPKARAKEETLNGMKLAVKNKEMKELFGKKDAGEAMWGYRNYIRSIIKKNDQLPEKKLTIDSFISYMEAQVKDNNKPYQGVIEKLKEIKAKDPERADFEFKYFALAFDIFNIGNKNREKGYQNLIQQVEKS